MGITYLDEEKQKSKIKYIDESQPNQQGMQPAAQPQNILGMAGNVPGAAIRSLLQGTGYAQGAMQPNSVPGFEQPIMDAAQGQNTMTQALLAPLYFSGQLANQATDPLTMLGFTGPALGATKMGKQIAQGVNKLSEATKPPDFSKIAGKVVNSLIRPTHQNLLFGKNPGMGIAKEGIIASNMEDLLGKVGQKTDELMTKISTIRATTENVSKTVDLSDSLKPLQNVYSELQKAPKTHSTEINQIKNVIDDLNNTGKLNQVNISDAYEIKNIVSKMQTWKNESEGGKAINSALKQVYHTIDKKIDKAIPELEGLNSRVADMISARKAIEHRIERLQAQEPANWSSLLNLPFAVYRSTPVKTTLGKILAKGYKK